MLMNMRLTLSAHLQRENGDCSPIHSIYVPAVRCSDMLDKDQPLITLIEEWEGYARRAFLNAEHEKDPMGKRLIEHGAMCYFNCAQQLKTIQVSISLQPLAIQEKDQK